MLGRVAHGRRALPRALEASSGARHLAAAPRAVFNRKWKRAQRERAAAAAGWSGADYLREAMAQQLLDRLGEVRTPCPVVAEIGCGTGSLLNLWRGEGGASTWIQMDVSSAALRRAASRQEVSAAAAASGAEAGAADGSAADSDDDEDEDDDEELLALMEAGRDGSPGARGGAAGPSVVRVVADPESLPLRPHSVDAVVSVLDLHWANDVEGVLRQVRRALKPDGLFLAVLLGGETGHELTSSLVAAELERQGGVGTRASPMMHVADAGALLSAAGFAMPAVDTGFIQVEYDNAAAAMDALSAMGESAAPAGQEGPSLGAGGGRDALLAAAAVMQWRHGDTAMTLEEAAEGAADPRTRQPEGRGGRGAGESGGDPAADADALRRMEGGVPVTFQTVWMVGFAPAQSQPQPIERGSVPHGFRIGGGDTADDTEASAAAQAADDGAGGGEVAPPAGASPAYPGLGDVVDADDDGSAPSRGRR
ncbi:hypothetical protein FNF29_06148 [Cafeteria roenbergensis]|uniref:Methyltransferase type 11 domain-containing protein n=1 Tax=Cafeteria roenbergensis TaxID=33653 RepID=A0A5A8D0E3_CAFRO|nr:hypothetical protein FNF29_06148 [Cafeteria roenbergensis]KAA0157850.1 hypothetical protein FNF31_05663 [Cafeteria roenbergensis]KAA0164643.1 hypothetical protein FNF28_03704 [Cafeteria roenbergensis]|eukprot:KAA0149261.1 hypothetical protein FNF29_06148 [Cafeteria roenbergensis]